MEHRLAAAWRWLRRYGSRLNSGLDQRNGFTVLAGLILAVAGISLNVPMREWLIYGGLVIAAAVIGYVLITSWPPKSRRPQEVEGQEISLLELDAIYPPVPALAIMGAAGVGKTTLKNYLLRLPGPVGITQFLTAHISGFMQDARTLVAVLDAPGDKYGQQFDILDVTDLAIVMLDHEMIQGQIEPNAARLNSHVEYGKQLRDHLDGFWKRHPNRPSIQVHVLMNKSDEWESATPAGRAALTALLDAEATAWRTLPKVSKVTSAIHSNVRPDDLTNLFMAIREHWREIQASRA